MARLRSMQVGLVEKFEKLLVGIKEEYRWIWKAVCVEGVPLRSVARALDISGDLLVWKIEEICAQVCKGRREDARPGDTLESPRLPRLLQHGTAYGRPQGQQVGRQTLLRGGEVPWRAC